MYTQAVKLLLRSSIWRGAWKNPTSHVIDPKVLQANCSCFPLRKKGQFDMKSRVTWDFFLTSLHMKTVTAPHKQIYLDIKCKLCANAAIWWIHLYNKQEWQLKRVLKQTLGKASTLFNSYFYYYCTQWSMPLESENNDQLLVKRTKNIHCRQPPLQ